MSLSRFIKRVEVVAGHTFLPRLSAQSLVVDLGANSGRFANQINALFGCTVYAVEASPRALSQMPESKQLHKLNRAITDHNHPVRFNVAHNSYDSSIRQLATDSVLEVIEVPGVTLSDLLAELKIESVDLLKVDIEGAEVELFSSTANEVLLRIGQISLEFHDFCGLMTHDQVDAIVKRLTALGFVYIPFPPAGMDCLFVNRRKVRFHSLERMFVTHVICRLRKLTQALRQRRSQNAGSLLRNAAAS